MTDSDASNSGRTNKEKFELISDPYRKARCGYSPFLTVSCEKCAHLLALYQKDGPGPLRRMYLDRIRASNIVKSGKDYSCPSCKKVIGTSYEYAKENRKAIRLYQDAVTRKTSTGTF